MATSSAIQVKDRIRLELVGPFFVASPGREVELEKLDHTIRFAPIAFKDPDQTLKRQIN